MSLRLQRVRVPTGPCDTHFHLYQQDCNSKNATIAERESATWIFGRNAKPVEAIQDLTQGEPRRRDLPMSG
jgi:hypothetical protein